MNHQPNYYDILGVAQDATQEEIRIAAETRNAQFPMSARDPVTNRAYEQLANAYQVLSSPELRARYDAQLDASQSTLLSVNVQSSRQVIGALDSDQLLYVLLDLRPPTLQPETTLPVNVALVIDRSTSMQGARLEQVKAAAKLVVEQLGPEDIISIIAFGDRAQIISPAGRLHNRNLLISRVSGMTAAGGTEIYQGLKAGLDEMSQVDLSRYINKLILLTDGHTYGDEEECLNLASRAAGQNIVFSAMGLGADWNDRFLDQLVAPSGGQSTYIEEPGQIISCLQEQIRGLGAIYAQNVRLELGLPAGITIQYAMKLAPFSLPISSYQNRLKLGTVEGRSPLTLLLELLIKPQPVGQQLRIPLRLLADFPAQGQLDYEINTRLELLVMIEDADVTPPPIIIRAVQMLNLYRMNERVWNEVEAGQLEMATQRMRRLSTRLMESGHSKLAYEAIVETQRLTRIGTMSLEGRKKLKYGTRSLLTKTMSLDAHDEMQ